MILASIIAAFIFGFLVGITWAYKSISESMKSYKRMK